jgi:hypothetical protein
MSSPGHDDLLLDFQDSQVSSIQAIGADLRVVLSAAHVFCPVGRFAQAPEETEGYLAPVLLLFRQARWQGELTLAMGRLEEGELWISGQRLRRLPLPCESTTPVRARLALANGVVLEIEAEALACPLSGDERFMASLAC